jgi:hypothetical protein
MYVLIDSSQEKATEIYFNIIYSLVEPKYPHFPWLFS